MHGQQNIKKKTSLLQT